MARAEALEDWPRTVADFQEWHAHQEEMWEFISGQPWMMAPGSMRHSILKNNVGFALRQVLAAHGCTSLIEGPQILTDEIVAIPGVVVTCSAIDLSTPVIAEPVIIVEVMSPSTGRDDAGLKWLSYSKIASLDHYIIVSQEQRQILVHSRVGDIWHERFISDGAVELDDPPVRLDIDAIYAGAGLSA